jgi:hypothetical protein
MRFIYLYFLLFSIGTAFSQEKNQKEVAKKLKVGHKVSIAFSKTPSSKDRYDLALFGYDSGLERPTNCIVQGTVQKKKKSKGSCILTIKVGSGSNCDHCYYGNTQMIEGQTFSYNMTYFNLRVIQ